LTAGRATGDSRGGASAFAIARARERERERERERDHRIGIERVCDMLRDCARAGGGGGRRGRVTGREGGLAWEVRNINGEEELCRVVAVVYKWLGEEIYVGWWWWLFGGGGGGGGGDMVETAVAGLGGGGLPREGHGLGRGGGGVDGDVGHAAERNRGREK
jgi:hypothetical protein